MTLDISKVAIIGAGPAGLASIYELTHTNKDGTSTVGSSKSSNPKFTKIVAFEQKDKAGGIWAPSLNETDVPVPPQEILDTEKYNDPDVIHPQLKIPSGIENASYENPIVEQGDQLYNDKLEWKRSGVYADLFTNIPSRFVRFSYQPNEPEYLDEKRVIYPFLSQYELSKRIEDFIENENLNEYIRFNTRVEKVTKNSNNKWVITVRQISKDLKEHWYQEEFDAIILSNGHYTVPNIPHIPGLSKFNKLHPDSTIHSKSYRNHEEFKDQNVLVVGFGISTANLVQYIVPLAKKTIVTQRGPHLVFDWINQGLKSDGITHKPQIKEILADERKVVFTDGSVEENIDKILLTTGYHYHYPFLNDHLRIVNPSNLSRVAGLYYNTFSIEDPTLASVGVTVAHLTFHAIEASAAAIAGVWSGIKSLPSKEEQKNWERNHLEETGDNLLFHFYVPDKVKPEYVDKIYPLAPLNRPNPLEKDGDFINEIDIGVDNLEKLFYKIKNKELDIKDTVYPVKSSA